MPAAQRFRPLVLAALALVRDGVTDEQLERRFLRAGARLTSGTAQQLLDEMARLGLVRIASARAYVLTSVGQRRLEDGAALGHDETDRLAELEMLRTDLLSTIAHELRTPLTVLRTSIGLLQDPNRAPDDEQRRALLATIERNAERMQRLVGDILELARFRSGTVTLQLRRFDGRALARAALASVQPLAEASGQRVKLKLPSAPVWVFGDHRRLEQALVNLLSNAYNYSPPGSGIELRVTEGDGEVGWSVADEGVGIDPADRARLFERFFVGRADRSGGRSGVGLGLPTTLAIAQAHGGRVEVDSVPGAGSLFTLVVPSQGPEEEGEG
jgi:signal transduction histidine kinase